MKCSPDKKIVIAVDGFSSCGKSTFAKKIASALGYVFIDTGAMYRAVTLYGIRHGAIRGGVVDAETLERMLPRIGISFVFNPAREASDIYLDGENVEGPIRSLEVSEAVSRVSQIGAVRERLVGLQQQMGRDKGIVMDGRDIGTVVFPDAELKIFMTADPAVRAMRRYRELTAKGEKVSLEEIERNIREPGPRRPDARDQPAASGSRRRRARQQPHDARGADGVDTAIRRITFSSDMHIEIDEKSGFCFGVVKAITKAEQSLSELGRVCSLGDIVHNRVEVQRLEKLGLETISHDELRGMSGRTVLIRAHGEPPSTYDFARRHGIRLIDATCPVVARLQKLVKSAHEEMKACGGQVVILGKRGHAEVVGLTGQVDGDAIVVETPDDLQSVDFSRPICLLSQTTQSLALFEQIRRSMLERPPIRRASSYTTRSAAKSPTATRICSSSPDDSTPSFSSAAEKVRTARCSIRPACKAIPAAIRSRTRASCGPSGSRAAVRWEYAERPPRPSG